MNKNIIEKIAMGVFALAVVLALVFIPVGSWIGYSDYLAQMQNSNENGPTVKPPKAVLESISAELVDGVEYYANGKAFAKVEDFVVTAHYTYDREEEGYAPFDEVVETNKYSVSTGPTFYEEGGDITITFRGKTAVVNVSLVPVVLESLAIARNPYRVTYAVGQTFNPEGMLVKAVYNDGSDKELSASDYTVDTTKQLTKADTAVTVSYTESEVTKTAEVAITVDDTVEDGDVVSLAFADDVVVAVGSTFADAEFEVNAVYESGNRSLLETSAYTISNPTQTVEFGKEYILEVTYNENTAIKQTAPVVASMHIEGETGTIVSSSGKVNTEPEYTLVDGAYVQGEDVTFAGNFTRGVTEGNGSSVSYRMTSATAVTSDLTLRCSNSYCVAAPGGTANGYMMMPLQINTAADLTVNGKEVLIPDDVILAGCGPYKTYAPLFGVYSMFTIQDVPLEAGMNEIKFTFKQNTKGYTNVWGESISTFNIDWFDVEAAGNEIPDVSEVASLTLNGLDWEYDAEIASIEVPVIGHTASGHVFMLDPSLYDITITGGEGVAAQYVDFDTAYTVTASLKSDPTVTVSEEVTVERFTGEFVVKTADILIDNNRVYYVFSGTSVGWLAEDIELFDGTTFIEGGEFTFNRKNFTVRYDVTDRDAGFQFYPHMRIGGVNYKNGGVTNGGTSASANQAGDVFGNGLTFTTPKTVTLNGKNYKITQQYNMPRLNVSAA